MESKEQQAAEEEVDEFAVLHGEVVREKARFEKLASMARAEGKPDIAAIYSEMGSTICSLMKDMVETTGGAVDGVYEDMEELGGGEGSRLDEDDARDYLTFFGAVEQLYQLVRSEVPDHIRSKPDVKEYLDTFETSLKDRIAFTREISGLDEAEEDAGEEEPN